MSKFVQVSIYEEMGLHLSELKPHGIGYGNHPLNSLFISDLKAFVMRLSKKDLFYFYF